MKIGLAGFLTFFLMTLSSPSHAGSCSEVFGVIGPEDIEVDASLGVAYISSTDRRGTPKDGAIYRLDLDQASSQPTRMKGTPPGFRPHGISLLKEAGRTYLFAINHQTAGGTRIERFEVISSAELRHLDSSQSPLIQNANDLHAVTSTQFYVTVDHGGQDTIANTLGDLFSAKTGQVYFYNGADFTRATPDLSYPNGITTSSDGSTLYVSSTLGEAIYVFQKFGNPWGWKQVQKVKTVGLPDNLNWNQSGQLYVGIQPSRWDFVGAYLNSDSKAGSRVISYQVLPGGLLGAVQTRFEDLAGAQITTSSVGAPYGKQLLVGSVFDDHILRCN